MNETQEKIGDWLFRRIGGNHIVIFPHPTIYTNSALPMTGANATFYISIPYMHRLNKIVYCHLVAAGTDSPDPLTLIFELEAGKSSISPLFHDRLLNIDKATSPVGTEIFGDGLEYEARDYTLTLKSTSTDLVIPLIYIQKIANLGMM